MLAFSDDEPSEQAASRKEDLRVLLRRIGISVGIALAAVLCIAFSVSLSRGSDGARGGFWIGAIFLFGAVGCLIAIAQFVSSVVWFVRVPKFATPKEVADGFYRELLGGGSFSRAWSSLDATARARFTSLEDFKKYWKTRQNDMKEWAVNTALPLAAGRPKGPTGILRSAVSLKGVDIVDAAERTAVLRCEIIVSAYEPVEAKKDLAGNPIFVTVFYGRSIWPQTKTLLKGPTRWYLTSGTLDGPTT